MHFSWNNSWLCCIFLFRDTFLGSKFNFVKRNLSTRKFYNSLKNENSEFVKNEISEFVKNEISEFVDVGFDEKSLFIYCSEHCGTSRKNGWKKLVKWRTRKKKSAASEVHYGRNFLILYKHYKAFFPKSRNLVLKVLVLH